MTELADPTAIGGVRPWTFSKIDDNGNMITLTIIPTPDGAIGDAHTYRDSGCEYAALLIGQRTLHVGEGSTLVTGELAIMGFSVMADLDGVEVSVNDLPTAPSVDLSGQA